MQPWYLRSTHGTLLTGLVPFAVLFIELLFLFKNLWQDKSGYYYVFGFLSSVSLILLVTISEVTIIATYSQLCAEVYSPSPENLSSKSNANKKKESPLVVAELPHRQQQRGVDLRILHLVLFFQAEYHGLRVGPAVLQL